MSTPNAPPPSYAIATGSSTTSRPSPASHASHLQVRQSHNAIPAAKRRSMEDEQRPLPPGWVRQYDEREDHQFFVDTRAHPPRSIWIHPYDDDDYLATLSSAERERIQQEEHDRLRPDLDRMSARSAEGVSAPLPPRPERQKETSGLSGLGRKFKDKVTGLTHEERQQLRAKRAQEEREYYEAHQAFRRALQQAQITGEPQFLAKDKDGRDVYIEPPSGPGGPSYGGYMSPQRVGYSPYTSGPYGNPNARFIRPSMPYNRPYGPGYGGGLGLPIAGGLMGGMLLGGLLF